MGAGGLDPHAYHWDEKKFRLEIMSEKLDRETAATRTFEFNAISAITVGALKDIGYEVDMQNAEPFQLQKVTRRCFERAGIVCGVGGRAEAAENIRQNLAAFLHAPLL